MTTKPTGYIFDVHNKRMTEFRKSHAESSLTNGDRLSEGEYLMRLHPLRVGRATVGAGDSVYYRDMSAISQTAPIWEVASYRFSAN